MVRPSVLTMEDDFIGGVLFGLVFHDKLIVVVTGIRGGREEWALGSGGFVVFHGGVRLRPRFQAWLFCWERSRGWFRVGGGRCRRSVF